MNKRDQKFIHRILVLLLISMVSALGVVVVLESKELLKLASNSTARTLLLFLAPLAALAGAGFGLTYRTHSARSLITELIVLVGAYAFNLAITLSNFFTASSSNEKGCYFWQLGCSDNIARMNWWIFSSLTVLSIFLLLFSIRREGILLSTQNK